MVLTMLISNSHLSIRALRMEDKDILVKWMSNPTVLQYYQGRDEPLDMEKVTEIFYDPDTEDVQCIIEYEGVPIGYIQYYVLDEESRQTYGYQDADEIIYGMDQFIGKPEYWNRGIGTLLIQTMTTFLIQQKQAHRIAMDPQTWNIRALHCYEKCGFQKVKLLPKHEWHEGQYRDCWLIEYKR